MTNEMLNEKIYVVDGGEITPMTYEDFLLQWGSDLCTAPSGVKERAQVRAIKDDVYRHSSTGEEIWGEDFSRLSEDAQAEYEFFGENEREYQIWNLGSGGCNPYYTGYPFETREDADMYVWDILEERANNYCDTPPYYLSMEEAEEAVKQGF